MWIHVYELLVMVLFCKCNYCSVHREWTGEMRFVPNIKMRKLQAADQRQLEKAASQTESSEETCETDEVK